MGGLRTDWPRSNTEITRMEEKERERSAKEKETYREMLSIKLGIKKVMDY